MPDKINIVLPVQIKGSVNLGLTSVVKQKLPVDKAIYLPLKIIRSNSIVLER